MSRHVEFPSLGSWRMSLVRSSCLEVLYTSCTLLAILPIKYIIILKWHWTYIGYLICKAFVLSILGSLAYPNYTDVETEKDKVSFPYLILVNQYQTWNSNLDLILTSWQYIASKYPACIIVLVHSFIGLTNIY